tara:strand:+ start:11673 stop:12404 length:732 start_codon:yes stop_codon:yes gene_type:complete
MKVIYKKELGSFFSTTIGPIIIGLFLLINGMLLWSEISNFNILDNAYASMDIFFTISPLIFLIFIPAVSMRSFSEEYHLLTIEIIVTKPITAFQIVFAKFLAVLTLIFFSLSPTVLYVITIYFLGETVGNIDLAAVIGSYIGILLLSSIFSSICLFASSLTSNQIIAFVLGIILSAVFYFGFDLLSDFAMFESIDFMLQKIGISYHYNIMSTGLIRLSDIIYFLSISFVFIKLTELVILNQKK